MSKGKKCRSKPKTEPRDIRFSGNFEYVYDTRTDIYSVGAEVTHSEAQVIEAVLESLIESLVPSGKTYG